MSRKTDTQNLSMSFQRHGQQWQVKFPSNFPRSDASLCTNGEVWEMVGGDTVRIAVRAIISAINQPAAGAGGIHGGNPARMAAAGHAQWYGGEYGEATLKYVVNELTKIADSEVKMSRKTDTQDVTLSFNRRRRSWKVKFPSNFPRSNASLSTNGEFYAMVGGDTVETAVSAITNRISSLDQPLAAVQWYSGEYGEATLKYVFSELRKIAVGDVNMSRKTDTQDITLCFRRQGREWQVKFPSNFPRSTVILSANGEVCAIAGGDTVEHVVNEIINHITSMDHPPVVRSSRMKLCNII
ncbi:hypothetical protein OS493_026262 [Desmophyllum pertusum]|uniref:Uncharacterized protein n=1 Tax=Desmophyllum pertusum TaxID=174260 RepID=A0A9W9ZL53_9CNID|nr:hypothetical protein OS493_026262 [Desmophyllum pertusum]